MLPRMCHAQHTGVVCSHPGFELSKILNRSWKYFASSFGSSSNEGKLSVFPDYGLFRRRQVDRSGSHECATHCTPGECFRPHPAFKNAVQRFWTDLQPQCSTCHDACVTLVSYPGLTPANVRTTAPVASSTTCSTGAPATREAQRHAGSEQGRQKRQHGKGWDSVGGAPG